MAIVAFGGSWLVKRWLASTYKTWSQVPNTYRVTGAQTAAATNNNDNKTIEISAFIDFSQVIIDS